MEAYNETSRQTFHFGLTYRQELDWGGKFRLGTAQSSILRFETGDAFVQTNKSGGSNPGELCAISLTLPFWFYATASGRATPWGRPAGIANTRDCFMLDFNGMFDCRVFAIFRAWQDMTACREANGQNCSPSPAVRYGKQAQRGEYIRWNTPPSRSQYWD